MAVWATEDLEPGDEVLSTSLYASTIYVSIIYVSIIYYLSRCSAITATIRCRLSPYPRWRLWWSEQDLIGAFSQEFRLGAWCLLTYIYRALSKYIFLNTTRDSILFGEWEGG